MATTNSLRALLDLKVPELLSPTPVASAAGVCVIAGDPADAYYPTAPGYIPELIVVNATTHYLYNHNEDAYVQIPSGTLTGTFGAGACGTFHPMGPTGTASAGGASTITTQTTLNRRLDGYVIRITGGTGAGQERTIASNTLGANSVVTVTSAWGTAPDATSTYVLITGRYYVWIPGTGSAFGWKYFDLATMAWSSALTANPGALASFGTDGRCVATAGALTGTLATGTATAGASTTLTDGGRAWGTNQWSNMQVRITTGTGRGQVRTISSNTGTVLTVSAAWTTTPDATSVYIIEGNDDHIFLMGNANVALYRYSISGNAWTTLSPGVARAGAPGAGASLIHILASDSVWTTEGANLKGRYLYSLRGGGASAIDVYDIAANSWSAITYGPAQETFTTGTSGGYDGNSRIYLQKDATNRWFYFDVVRQELRPWATVPLTQGAALVGDRTWAEEYRDGATTLRWIYHWMSTSSTLYRTLVIA